MKTEEDQKRIKQSALIVSTIACFLSPYLGSAVNVCLPAMQQDLSIDAVLLSWITTSYVLTNAIFALPLGKVSDIWGRKKSLATGIGLIMISSFLCFFAGSAEVMIALRVFQGIGGGLVSVTGLAIVSSIFPPHERGKVLGIVIASIYAGLSVGPFAGGFLTQNFGWKSVFLSAVLLGLIAFLFIVLGLKGEWADAAGERLDFSGCILYSLSIFLVTYGATMLPSINAGFLIGGGVICLFFFVVHQMRSSAPLFDVRLFVSNRVFAFSSLAALIHYSAIFAVTFLMSLYLQYVLGLSPQTAGLILLAQPLVQTFFTPVAGKLSDMKDPGRVASLGMAVTGLGLLLLIFLKTDSSLLFIVISLMIMGLGYAFFSSPNMNAIMGSVEKRHYGVASSVTATMRSLGMTASMAIATVTISICIGRNEIVAETFPALLETMRICFTIFIVLCCFGIVASLSRGKVNK